MASNEKRAMCNSCQDYPFEAFKNAGMFKAVRDGHLECLKAAVEAGANVNDYDELIEDTMAILLDPFQLERFLDCSYTLKFVVEDRWEHQLPSTENSVILRSG